MSGNNLSFHKKNIGCDELWINGQKLSSITDVSSSESDWINFTPTIGGQAQRADASTVKTGRYKQIGKTVHVEYHLAHSGGAGSATSLLTLSLPVASKTYVAGTIPAVSLGSAYITSTTSATGYIGVAYLTHTTGLVSFRVINQATPSVAQLIDESAVPNMSEAAFGLFASLTYEAL